MTQDEQLPAKDEAEPTGRLRGLERLFWVAVPFTLLVVGAGAYWGLRLEQLTFLAIGIGCLCVAWTVWRYRIVGYSHSEGLDPETGEVRPPTTTVTKSPVPREVLAPLLVVAAVMFLLAATPTGVGALLDGPAHIAVEGWRFVEATWNLLPFAAFVVGTVVALVYGVARRDREAITAGGCLGSLMLVAIALNYAYYLIDADTWRHSWSEFFAPVRTVIEFFS